MPPFAFRTEKSCWALSNKRRSCWSATWTPILQLSPFTGLSTTRAIWRKFRPLASPTSIRRLDSTTHPFQTWIMARCPAGGTTKWDTRGFPASFRWWLQVSRFLGYFTIGSNKHIFFSLSFPLQRQASVNNRNNINKYTNRIADDMFYLLIGNKLWTQCVLYKTKH